MAVKGVSRLCQFILCRGVHLYVPIMVCLVNGDLSCQRPIYQKLVVGLVKTMIFKFNSSVATALSTFILTTGLGLWHSSANAFTFTLNKSSGTWSNVIGGYDEYEGVDTVNFINIGTENQVLWGTPVDLTSSQSGLGFTGAGGSTRQLGEPFLLGTLRHINKPIYEGTAAEVVDLTINLDLTINSNSSQSNHLAKSFAFTLGIDETPNTALLRNEMGTPIEDNQGNFIQYPLTPRSALQPWIEDVTCKYPGITSCPDRIFPLTTIPQDSVNIEGTNYTLEFVGFSNMSNRPFIIPGLTEEGKDNAAELYVFGKIIKVENIAPSITPSNKNLTVNEGDWFNFSAEATDRNNDPLSFEWDLNNDGKYDDFAGPRGQSFFEDNGLKPIRLKVSDGNPQGDTYDSFEVLVKNVSPTLTGLELPTPTILEGESASILLAATDPGADTISFLLNNNLIGQDTRTLGTRQASLDLGIFADNGTFTYTGQAEDKDGDRSNSISKIITVLNVAPTITTLTDNLTIFQNELFNFTATAFDPGVNDLLTYDWDFNNDGVYNDATGNSGQWSFTNPGTYKIGVRVSDGDGGVAMGYFNVTAQAVPEPSSALGILIFSAGSASWLYKRKKQ